MALKGKHLWWVICGRGSHEKAHAELKSGFAFDCVPTREYGANSAWRVLSALDFNLMKSFQVATTATPRSRSRKHRVLCHLQTIQSLRYQWLNRAGRLSHPNGIPTLDLGTNPTVQTRFMNMTQRLSDAALFLSHWGQLSCSGPALHWFFLRSLLRSEMQGAVHAAAAAGVPEMLGGPKRADRSVS